MSKLLSAPPCCTACGSAAIVKNGHKRLWVGAVRLPGLWSAPGAYPKRQPVSAPRQQEILRAVASERLSLRAAERVFGVARQTIAKWLEERPRLSRR